MRKLLTGAVFFFSSAAFATGICPVVLPQAISGFYVGGGIGASGFADNQSTPPPTEGNQLGNVGFIGGGFLGYLFNPNNHFDLGAELFVNGTTDKATITHLNGTSFTIKEKSNWGIRALPGYHFTPTAEGHLLIGYARGNFNIFDNGAYAIINNNFSANGFQFGLGTTLSLSKHLYLRADGIYTGYASQNSTGLSITIPVVPAVYRNKIQNVDAIVSLIYNFA